MAVSTEAASGDVAAASVSSPVVDAAVLLAASPSCGVVIPELLLPPAWPLEAAVSGCGPSARHKGTCAQQHSAASFGQVDRSAAWI